ncbi:zinc metalloprotease HtpX [Candidatus Shapirobacteria bacterium]|nr:zinc metalloprotease HtpX [Candidatus Shapirobacteria bacterium]
MLNIYEQINSNKQRSVLIMSLFTGFILLAIYSIGYVFNIEGMMPLAILFSLFSTGASYFWGDKIVLSLNGARPASRKEFFDFYTATENLAMVAKIPTPQIYVIDSPAMNAFATGRDPEHAVICATTGILDKLDRTELEGVIGHELSHVKNYDIRLMTIVSILVGSLSILINMASRSLWFGGGRRDNDDRGGNGILMIIGVIMIIFAPIIAQLIQLAISRRREYFADASSVMLTRQPSGLISALKKLESDRTPQQFASTATASLYISNPFKGNKLGSLFSTHPPIADRIAALQKML